MESINIGIAGLGTVGAEVAKQLKTNVNFLNKKAGAKLNLTAISARNKGKDRGFDASNLIWIEVAEDLAFEKEVDVAPKIKPSTLFCHFISINFSIIWLKNLNKYTITIKDIKYEILYFNASSGINISR